MSCTVIITVVTTQTASLHAVTKETGRHTASLPAPVQYLHLTLTSQKLQTRMASVTPPRKQKTCFCVGSGLETANFVKLARPIPDGRQNTATSLLTTHIQPRPNHTREVKWTRWSAQHKFQGNRVKHKGSSCSGGNARLLWLLWRKTSRLVTYWPPTQLRSPFHYC